jgi:hypothetical protein
MQTSSQMMTRGINFDPSGQVSTNRVSYGGIVAMTEEIERIPFLSGDELHILSLAINN